MKMQSTTNLVDLYFIGNVHSTDDLLLIFSDYSLRPHADI